jgi:hypothetical protein
MLLRAERWRLRLRDEGQADIWLQPAAPGYQLAMEEAWDDLVAASGGGGASARQLDAESCAGRGPAGVLLLPEAAPDRDRQARLQAEHDRVRLPRAVLDVQGRPPAVGLHLGRGRVSALRMAAALSTS